MPTASLNTTAVLTHDPGAAKKGFDDLFKQENRHLLLSFKPKLAERSITDRLTNRVFNKHASWSEAAQSFLSGTTNYEVICKQLHANHCVAVAAQLSFMINAANPILDEGGPHSLKFLKSDLASGNSDIPQRRHHLLVEEHIIAFAWEPDLSPAYHALNAIAKTASVAATIAGTVLTAGVAAPALVSALRQAARAGSELYALCTNIQEGADAVGQLYTAATEALAVPATVTEIRKHKALYDGGATPGAGYGATTFSGGPLDPAANIGSGAPQKKSGWWGLRDSKTESQSERYKREGKEHHARQKEFDALEFVVVQMITPLIEDCDNPAYNLKNREINFQSRIYLRKESYMRVGQIDRTKYVALIELGKINNGSAPIADSNNATRLICLPWIAHGGFLRYWNSPGNGLVAMKKDAPQSVNWDMPQAVRWNLVLDEPAKMRMSASVAAQEEQARRSAQMSRYEGVRRELVSSHPVRQSRWDTAQRVKTVAEEKAHLEKINAALNRTVLPSPADFVLQTTTRTGPFTNARDNPKLLLIDGALKDWQRSKIAIRSPDGVRNMKEALKRIRDTCDDFIHSKVRASRDWMGHVSERNAPVARLRDAAVRILDSLP